MSETPTREHGDDSATLPPIAADEALADSPSGGNGIVRWLVWAIAVIAFAGYVLLARVHTRLGVEAPSFDKDGRDYVWRSWWRARNDIVDIGPDMTATVAYIGLALAFLALSAVAFWVALVPDDPGSQPIASSDIVEP